MLQDYEQCSGLANSFAEPQVYSAEVALCINSYSHYKELPRGLISRSTSSKSMELAHKDQWMLHSQLNKHRCISCTATILFTIVLFYAKCNV